MTSQTELVPRTAEERVAELRRDLRNAITKAEERVEKAQAKADAAAFALAEFDAAIAAVAEEASHAG